MNLGIPAKSVPAPLIAMLEHLETLDLAKTKFPAALTVDSLSCDTWQWLLANPHLCRIVWSDRSTNEIEAGIGIAAELTLEPYTDASKFVARCRAILNGNQHLKFFGGFSFDGSDAWQNFGAGRFVIPRLSVDQRGVTINVMNAEDVKQAIADLKDFSFQPQTNATEQASKTSVKFTPNFDGWQSRVDEALSLIRNEVLEKIVLARKTDIQFSKPLEAVELTTRLKAATNDCFVFCFNFQPESAFVGATPECLFSRQADLLESEVIAGTRMRGSNPAEDERLAIELLTSDKDQREHDIVRKSIRQKLHMYVDHLDVASQAAILRLAHKQHLHSAVSGRLKPGIDDGMLLNRLHPTPAVGGYPTDNALREIARIEPFNRGWYAAPVGWIGADSIQFTVAIRSGLIESDRLSLYSGAGIVRGSEPTQEWQEIENKIQDFISVLH